MQLEEAIKQKHFSDDYQKAIINILFTANWLREEQTILLKAFDILPQHFNVLRIIKGRHPEPVSPGDIRDVMVDKANDLTRLLDKLEKKGWIKRMLCPVDRRKMDVTLTAEGLKALAAANKELEGFSSRIRESITGKDVATLSSLLDKMRF